MASYGDYRLNTGLTQEQMDDIRQMLFGPYEDEWRDENGIVNNSDMAIAKRLQLPYNKVYKYTILITREHFNYLDNERNSRDSSE